jgi:CBS domain-containing protein
MRSTTIQSTLNRRCGSSRSGASAAGPEGPAVYLSRDVVLLAADMPAAMALRRLDGKAVSGAPVVDRSRVVGVITQRDLLVPTLVDNPAESPALGMAWHHNRLDGMRVRDLMSDEPVTAEPDWPLVGRTRR